MEKEVEFNYKGKEIELFNNENNNRTIIVLSYEKEGENFVNLLKEAGFAGFNIIFISNIDWNNELTPWKGEPIFKGDKEYLGEADKFLDFIENDLLIKIKNEYKICLEKLTLCGYSLAGLFTLYAGFKTNIFDSLICCSSSFWYKDFSSFVVNNKLNENVQYIYLSLGNKEHLTKNETMKTVLDNTNLIYENIKSRCINIEFELNEGGHFNDPLCRQIKGIKRLQNYLKTYK